MTIDALDDKCDNQLIEHMGPPYHALLATIEVDFDASLSSEVDNIGPLLYWLDTRQDVDELCSEILDGSKVTPHEAQSIALVHGGEITNSNTQAQNQ
jgi:hypothetical protein